LREPGYTWHDACFLGLVAAIFVVVAVLVAVALAVWHALT